MESAQSEFELPCHVLFAENAALENEKTTDTKKLIDSYATAPEKFLVNSAANTLASFLG
jgi:hypothetical protein